MNRCLTCQSFIELRRGCLLLGCWLLLTGPFLPAGEPPSPTPLMERLERRYVPASDLGAILEKGELREVMTLEEFERLVARARERTQNPPPSTRAILLSWARCEAELKNNILLAEWELDVTTTEPQVVLELPIAGWSVQALRWADDESPVAAARAPVFPPQLPPARPAGEGALKIFVPTAGRRRLLATFSGVLNEREGVGRLSVALPGAATAEMTLRTPPGQTLLINGRTPPQLGSSEDGANYHWLGGGQSRLNLELREAQIREQGDPRLIVATSYDVTASSAFIQWSAEMKLDRIGEVHRRVRVELPAAVQLTSVESPELASWTVEDGSESSRPSVTLQFREGRDGASIVHWRGESLVAPDGRWEAPVLSVVDAVTSTGDLRISPQSDTRLRVVETSYARPLPATAPQLRYQLSTRAARVELQSDAPPVTRRAAQFTRLDVQPEGLVLQTRLTLAQTREPISTIRLQLPADYDVEEVAAVAGGRGVDWVITPGPPGLNEVRVTLTGPAALGVGISLRARMRPENWPPVDTAVQLALPDVVVFDAEQVRCLYTISAPEEFEVTPVAFSGFEPASAEEMRLLEQHSAPARLAFERRAAAGAGQLSIARRPPFITVESGHVLRVDRRTVHHRLSARVSIAGGGARELDIDLPEEAGDQVRLEWRPQAGHSGDLISQQPGAVTEGWRRWRLTFRETVHGTGLLIAEFDLPRGDGTSWPVLGCRLPAADAHSGWIAVEGADDELVRVTAVDGAGAPLTSVDPVDFPEEFVHAGARVVDAFRFRSPQWSATASTSRFDAAPIPTAILHQLRLQSALMTTGEMQTAAVAVVSGQGLQGLLVTLPESAELWSVQWRNKPLPVRRREAEYWIALPSQFDREELTILYRSLHASVVDGQLQAMTPKFQAVLGNGDQQEVQVLDASWELHLPPDQQVRSSTGGYRLHEQPAAWRRWLQQWRAPSPERLLTLALWFTIAGVLTAALVWLARRVGARGKLALGLVLLGAVVTWCALAPVREQIVVGAAAPSDGRNYGFPSSLAAPVQSDLAEDQLELKESRSLDRSDEKSRTRGEMRGGGASESGVATDSAPRRQGSFDIAAPTFGGFDANTPAIAGLPISPAATPPQGRLSLAFGMQIPERSHAERFVYQGGALRGPGLDIELGERPTPWFRALAAFFIAACVGLWLAGYGAGAFTIVILLCLAPLAMFGWLPNDARLVAGAVALGGVIGYVSGLSRRLQIDCRRVRRGLALTLLAIGLTKHAAAADAPAIVPPPPCVVIPYDDLDALDAVQRVWLPADVLEWLRGPNASQLNHAPTGVVSADYSARIDAEARPPVVRIEAQWSIFSTAPGGEDVTLPLGNVLVDHIESAGQPLPLSSDAGGGLRVRVPGPGAHRVSATLQSPVMGSPAQGAWRVSWLPVPSGRLLLELPQDGLQLQVRPARGGQPPIASRSTTARQLEVSVDQGGDWLLTWRPLASPSTTAAVTQLEHQISAALAATAVQVEQSVTARIRQGALAELTLLLPPNAVLQSVDGADVQQWSVMEGSPRRLKVAWRSAGRESATCSIKMLIPQMVSAEEAVLDEFRARGEDIERETGLITLHVPPELQVRVATLAQMQQVNGEPAPAAAEGASVLAFRFSGGEAKLDARVSSRPTQLRSRARHSVRVGPRFAELSSQFEIDLQGPAQRILTIRTPDDGRVLEVLGANVASWRVMTSEQGRAVEVELQSPQQGALSLVLNIELERSAVEGEFALSPPELINDGSPQHLLAVWVDPSLRVSPLTVEGWRLAPLSDAPAPIRATDSRAPQAVWKSAGASRTLIWQVRRAEPVMTADAATLIAVSDASVDYGLTLRWTVTQAAADEFILTGPGWLKRLEITAPGVREIRTEDLPGERRRWTISLLAPVSDQFLATAAATIPNSADGVIATPELEFEGRAASGAVTPLAGQQQFVVLVNLSADRLSTVGADSPALALTDLPLKLPAALAQQAMQIARVTPAASPAWRREAIRVEGGQQAQVVAARLTTMLEHDGAWRTRAAYALRNRGRQFLALEMPEGATLLSVMVRERPARSVRGNVNGRPVELIALPRTSAADLSFEIVCLITGRLPAPLPGQGALSGERTSIPSPRVIPPEDSAEFGLPVAQTLWTVHLPDLFWARPTSVTAGTNLTWVRESERAADLQHDLSRYQADVDQLQRVLQNEDASGSQRSQAIMNLGSLQRKLQERATEAETLGLKAIRDQSLNVLSQSQAPAATPMTSEPQLSLSEPTTSAGRAYILRNNIDFQKSNAASAPSLDKDGLTARAAGADSEFGMRFWDSNGDLPLPIESMTAPGSPSSGDYSAPRELQQRGDAEGDSWSRNRMERLQDIHRGQEVALGAAPNWNTAGGLSLPMELPVMGRSLSFSKTGGDPQLTLEIYRKETALSLVAAAWTVVCLALAIWLVRAVRRGGRWGLLRTLAGAGLIAGLVLAVLAPHWAAFGLIIFVISLAIRLGCRLPEQTAAVTR